MTGTRGRALRTLLGGCGLAVLLCAVPGCPPKDSLIAGDLLPPAIEEPVRMPSYAELVRRYNARLVGLETLSCRTQVEAVWIDEKGKRRRESGKGKLIFRRPVSTALTVEAFGQTVMWAGSNPAQYWLFVNLHEDGELYYGSFDRAAGGVRSRTLVVPPDVVPFLLGLMPLSPEPPGGAPPVEALRGYAMIEPPGMGLRLLLEPATGTPRRVDLLDRNRGSEVICLMEGTVEVEGLIRPELHVEGGALVGVGLLGRNDAQRPMPLFMPEIATVVPTDDQAKMVIEFRSADAQDHRVRDELFDLGVLEEYLKPKTVVNLDEPAER